jgi:dihydroorotate dehydrogenase subfamily 1
MPINIPTLHTLAGLKIERTERSAVKTFTFYSKEIVKESVPGQFVMVWDPGVDEIPISIAHTVPDGRLELAIADVGDCSHNLHQKQVGDLIGLRGPYGTGFTLMGERICLVAGGYGAAPLRFAASGARALGKGVVVLEGAQCSADLLYLNEFRDLGCEVKVSTEDGSQGYCGMCTELFEELLASGEAYDQVLTCGPELMMKRVCELTKRNNTHTQLSVERIIKCSCGACGACDLGGYRVCKDGPVFAAEALENTEFGRWKREKSGKRIPLVATLATEKDRERISIPSPHFEPEYEPLLQTEVCGIEFPNPFMNAAGFGVSGKLLYRYATAGAGAVVTKSIGLDERDGYPNPTFIELEPRSYVNAMGLPNPGIANIEREIEDATSAHVPLVLSIFGKSVEECSEVAKVAKEYPVDLIEFDASCPHSEFVAIENKPKLLSEIVMAIKAMVHPKPVAVKISPNIGAPVGLALTAQRAGADAITAINTVIARPVEQTLDIPYLGNPLGYGGKSGKDLTVGGKQIVFELYRELDIPIIAVGGIITAQDLIDYARNGACLYQIGSALVSEGYELFARLKQDLTAYLRAHGYQNISELVGEAHR